MTPLEVALMIIIFGWIKFDLVEIKKTLAACEYYKRRR
jgi:hypothetical protein